MIWNYIRLLTFLSITLLQCIVNLKYRNFRSNWNIWQNYNMSKHRNGNSLNQSPTFLYIHNIHLFSRYVQDKFLPYLIVTSKHKWQYCRQTYRITTINLSSSFNVFIRLPNNSDMACDRYVTPLSYGLRLAVAFTACVLCVCLALTEFGNQTNHNLTASAILFYIHACFCQQGQVYKFCVLPSWILYF
jgi:hypothetical protein